MAKTYQAFISYRHLPLDIETAVAMEKTIERYTIPRGFRAKAGGKHFHRCFRDQDELPLSADLGGSIEDALLDSEWLVLICTPDFPKSLWCMREVDTFIAAGHRDRILPVLVSGTPETSFPPQLLFEMVDGIPVPREPLAVDLTGDSSYHRRKKLRTEKYRLFAKMLGVGFDELRQRARLYRTRLYLTACALALTVVAGFAVFAVNRAITINQERIRATENETQMLIAKSLSMKDSGKKIEAGELAREALDLSDTIGGQYAEQAREALTAALLAEDFGIRNLVGNGSSIYSLCYAPDDSRFLGISNYNNVKVFDGLTGEVQYTIQNIMSPVDAAVFSPDSTRILAACYSTNELYIYNAADGRLLSRYASPNAEQSYELLYAAFTENGTVFLAENEIYKILETDTCQILTGGETTNDLFIPNGTNLGTSGSRYFLLGIRQEQGKIYLLDSSDSRLLILNSPVQGSQMTDMTISTDNSRMALCRWNTVEIFDLTEEKRITEISLEKSVRGIRFTEDGSCLLILDGSGLTCYNVRDGKTVYRTEMELTYTDRGICLSPDGAYFYIPASPDLLYSTATGEVVSDLSERNMTLCCFSNRGDVLVAKTGSELTINTMPGQGTVIREPMYDGVIFDVPGYRQEKEKVTFHNSYYDQAVGSSIYQSKTYISPDGRYAVLVNDGTFIKVWDVDTHDARMVCEVIYRIYEHSSPNVACGDLAFTADSRYFATAGYNGRSVIFDLKNNAIFRVLSICEQQAVLEGVKFSPDGRYVMYATYNQKKLFVYSVESGTLLYTITPIETVTDFGFDTASGDAIVLYEDGSASRALLTLDMIFS